MKIRLSGKHTDKYTIVDDDNYVELSKYNWYYHNMGYATTTINGKIWYMDRLVAQTPKGMHTDHINHNKLDNRKANLRICTHAENMRNMPGRKGPKGHKRGSIKRIPYKDRYYYYGELRKEKKRYMTTTCDSHEQAIGALKQMIKEKGL